VPTEQDHIVRVTILAIGSRGDLDPFLALGAGLLAAGHAVRMATHRPYEERVTAAGLEFAELPEDPRTALASAPVQAMLTSRNVFAMPRLVRQALGPRLAEAAVPAERACEGADLVLASTLAMMGPTAAERAGAKFVLVHLQPATPTRVFAAAGAPVPRDLPGPLNLFLWAFSERVLWSGVLPALNARRRELGMAPLPAVPISRWPAPRPPILYGYSSLVAPVPPDWPADVHVTGYWRLPAPPGWVPPPELTAFLEAGPAPVYLGFGSMPDADPAGLADLLLTGLRRAGLRAVLHPGWSGLRPREAADDVLVVDDVPHAWLFPRVAAVLHHGGAGTTAAGLLAGAPTVVVPFLADQFFWARRVTALGAGPPAVPRPRLTAGRVAAALTAAVTEPRYRESAARLAARLSAEDGVAAAVAVLERIVRG
jgi:UDP:flavonoid glycosyltransferase YjiC (YdhE family)